MWIPRGMDSLWPEPLTSLNNRNQLTYLRVITVFGPRQANLVLIAYASSEGSGEPAHPRTRQNLRCSLIQAVSQEEPSDRKPDSWPL